MSDYNERKVNADTFFQPVSLYHFFTITFIHKLILQCRITFDGKPFAVYFENRSFEKESTVE